MVEQGIIFDPKDASKGAWQGIRKIEGVLQQPKLVPSKFKRTDPKTNKEIDDPKLQIEVKLTEAEILEMEPGEVKPDLKDDTYTFWMGYALPGAKPSGLSFYMAAFSASGKLLAKARATDPAALDTVTWQNLIGTRVTLVYVIDYHLGTLKDKKKGTEEEAKGKGWIFDTSGTGDVKEDINTHAKKLVVGFKPSAAKRNLMLDARTKRDASWKAALDDGSIEKKLGVKLGKDGKYAEA